MPAASSYSVLYKKENAHDDPIYTCIWTKIYPSGDTKGPSKDIVITGGLDALVKVWQMESDKLELLHTLRGHTMAVVSVAASPDGHTLASTSIDSSLIIWDLMSGQKVHVVPTKATDVWKVAFSPDGTLLATGSHTGKVVVYGVEKGLEERMLDTRGKFVICVAWNHDGKFLSCGAVDGTVCIFDVAQGKLLHTIEAHNHTVRSVAYSPNSKLLVTASSDGLVKVFDATSASLKASLPHGCWALDACFSPDGSRVASAAADGSVRVATVGDWKFAHSFMEHTDMVWDVRFNADANKLISVSKDKSIIIYDCPIPKKQDKK